MVEERPALVEIAVPLPLPRPLVYSVSATLRPHLRVGLRVRVPVGRRSLVGFVWRLDVEAPEGVAARPITALLDLEPPLPDDLQDLARFTADYYLAPIGEVLAAMLPQGLVPWGDRRAALTSAGALAPPRDDLDLRIRDHLLELGRAPLSSLRERIDSPGLAARLAELDRSGRIAISAADSRGSRFRAAFELAPGDPSGHSERCGRSKAGRAVVEYLAAAGRPAGVDELRDAGASAAVLKRLADLGILRRFSQPERIDLGRHLLGAGNTPEGVVPNADQEAALVELGAALEARRFARFLLQGVTGSGKTEVYLRAAARAIELGRSAILMVPEIALVPALAREATERFGDQLAVLHSGLGNAERHQEWERIRRGEARVVVGPRSALFAPLPGLGLIVVDEEQDLAYKQDGSPRYHGRDLALVRCRDAGAVALLVSATPSLETRLATRRGDLKLLVLPERVGAGRLPEGILVDLRAEAKIGLPGDVPFSARLNEELAGVLGRGDQAILLRNRRGYAPVLLCRACGEDFRCPDCGLPRTFHRRERRLVCHWCGAAMATPATCPSCRSEALEPVGAGTERIEEETRALFPGVAIDVLDRDAARRIGGAAAILEKFRRGDTRILIGTQMLSKGHHFPNVALTAVLSADAYLSFPDFRAVEKTYSLLTQIAGRAGRGARPGRVVIQTWHPDHYAIQAALRHDDASFAEQELRFREVFGYPPYSRMVLVLSRDRRREQAAGRLAEVAERLSRHPAAGDLRLSGPAPAPLERLRGEWRYQLIVRSPRGGVLRRAVAEALGTRSGGS